MASQLRISKTSLFFVPLFSFILCFSSPRAELQIGIYGGYGLGFSEEDHHFRNYNSRYTRVDQDSSYTEEWTEGARDISSNQNHGLNIEGEISYLFGDRVGLTANIGYVKRRMKAEYSSENIYLYPNRTPPDSSRYSIHTNWTAESRYIPIKLGIKLAAGKERFIPYFCGGLLIGHVPPFSEEIESHTMSPFTDSFYSITTNAEAHYSSALGFFSKFGVDYEITNWFALDLHFWHESATARTQKLEMTTTNSDTLVSKYILHYKGGDYRHVKTEGDEDSKIEEDYYSQSPKISLTAVGVRFGIKFKF